MFTSGEIVKIVESGCHLQSLVAFVKEDGTLVMTDGNLHDPKHATKTTCRLISRFPVTRIFVKLVREMNAITFSEVQTGMRLLVLVPSHSHFDEKNYEVAKLVTVAIKDADFKVVFDQDGEEIKLSEAYDIHEKATPTINGYLTEKGLKVIHQIYP